MVLTRYYKIIGEHKIYFPGYIVDGDNVGTNPSEEQILANGGIAEEYEPMTPEPMKSMEPDEHSTFEAMKKLLASTTESLTDEEALEVAAMFPTGASKLPEDPLNPKPEDTLSTGYRVWYNDGLYKVIQPHVPQSDWMPDVTPALYTKISIEEGPKGVQPTGAHDAYMKNAKVSHNNLKWINTIDYNVYEPGVYGGEEAQ